MSKYKITEPIPTSDFWYDLFLGGYFSPEKILVDEDRQRAIRGAIHIIRNYESELIEAGLIEEL